MSRKRKGKKMWVVACDADGCELTVARIQGSRWVEVRYPDWPEGSWDNGFTAETRHYCAPAHFAADYAARWRSFEEIEAEVAWEEAHPEPEPGTDPDWDRLVAAPAYQQPPNP